MIYRFRLAFSNSLLFSPEWEGESAVLVRQTGETHVLTELGRAVLELLEDEDAGCTPAELASRFEAAEPGEAERVTEAVERVLLEFERLGLLQRSPA